MARAHRVPAVEFLEVSLFMTCEYRVFYRITKSMLRKTGGNGIINPAWTLSSDLSIPSPFSLLLVSNQLIFPGSALMPSCKQFIICRSPYDDLHEQMFWWEFVPTGGHS